MKYNYMMGVLLCNLASTATMLETKLNIKLFYKSANLPFSTQLINFYLEL